MTFGDRLHKKLHYDPETGIFTWRFSTGGARRGSVAGGVNGEGYWQIWFDGRNHQAHRLAWFYMTGAWPSEEVDHKDGVRDNNRWGNLREASKAQNAQNRKTPITNRSGFIGADLHAASGLWRSQIQVSGRKIHLGTFQTAEEASAAYLAAKRELHPFQPAPRQDIAA